MRFTASVVLALPPRLLHFCKESDIYSFTHSIKYTHMIYTSGWRILMHFKKSSCHVCFAQAFPISKAQRLTFTFRFFEAQAQLPTCNLDNEHWNEGTSQRQGEATDRPIFGVSPLSGMFQDELSDFFPFESQCWPVQHCSWPQSVITNYNCTGGLSICFQHLEELLHRIVAKHLLYVYGENTRDGSFLSLEQPMPPPMEKSLPLHRHPVKMRAVSMSPLGMGWPGLPPCSGTTNIATFTNILIYCEELTYLWKELTSRLCCFPASTNNARKPLLRLLLWHLQHRSYET